MIKRIPFGLKVVLLLGVIAGLGGCEPEPTVAPPDYIGTQSALVLPTMTMMLDTPTPAFAEIEREFATYRHRSGVFAIAYPSDWEAIDNSTDRHILVRFDSPVGFGSRFIVDIENTGELSSQAVLDRLQSFIQMNYSAIPAYGQISQDLLADGRIQAVFLYNDGRGGKGQETLTVQQIGPYFTGLRIFLAENDKSVLTTALSSVASSMMVDPQAAWGNQVAAINPAELLVINSLLWRDKSKATHYTGEIYNASPANAGNIQVRVSICDKNDIILKEVTGEPALRVIPKGATIPFSIVVEDLPADVTVCSERVNAEPARSDSNYTTALTIESDAKLDARRQLVVSGTVSNPGLMAVLNVRLVIAVYDKEGRVIGFSVPDLGIGLRLEPGQSQPFDFTFVNLGGQADHSVTFVEAETVGIGDSSLKPPSTPTENVTVEGTPGSTPNAMSTGTSESAPSSTSQP
ncbi:MAG: hypothetical protein JXB07_03595 [Anaerolineae bacterium]|nr:hypothetical protein [Anaerolineae bacterium]